MRDLAYLLQQLLNGLQVSGFYALLAAGYVLVWGVTRRVNLAFGAMAMCGSYAAFNAAIALFLADPATSEWLLWTAALVAGAAGAGALGLVSGRAVIAPLMRRAPLAALIATIGLALTLEEAMRLINGNRERLFHPVLDEPWLTLTWEGFPIQVSLVQAATFALCIALAAGLFVAFARSRFGLIWRALNDDAGMVALLGIDVAWVVALSAGLAGSCAGAAGALMALYYGSVSFSMGFVVGLKALYAAILGGLGSPGGAIAAALALGLAETFWSAYLPLAWRDVAVLIGLTLALVLWPRRTGQV